MKVHTVLMTVLRNSSPFTRLTLPKTISMELKHAQHNKIYMVKIIKAVHQMEANAWITWSLASELTLGVLYMSNAHPTDWGPNWVKILQLHSKGKITTTSLTWKFPMTLILKDFKPTISPAANTPSTSRL